MSQRIRSRSHRFFSQRNVLALASTLLAGSWLAPAAASAQTYAATTQPITYTPMPLPDGGPVTNISGTEGIGWAWTTTTLPIALPFPVTFFGEAYTEIHVTGTGMVTFGDAYPDMSNASRTIPGSAAPHNFVAVWWDELVCNDGGNGPINEQVVGAAPNRFYVLQWTNCRRYAGSPANIEAQLWLSEATTTIEVRYGTIHDPNFGDTGFHLGAAIGVENIDGTDGTPGLALGGLDCSPDCNVTNFPSNVSITYTAGPSLLVTSVSGGAQGNPGAPMSMAATVRNGGIDPAEDFTVRFWIGPNASLTDAIELGVVPGAQTVAPGLHATFELDEEIPADLPLGLYYLIAEADPFHAVLDPGASPTLGFYGPFPVTVPMPDLAVLGGTLDAPRWIDEPGIIQVAWSARNLGTLDAADVPYQILLRPEPAGDEPGLVLHEASFDAAVGARVDFETDVEIPAEVEPGLYRIYLVIDPEETIDESNTLNNTGSSPYPLVIGLDLRVEAKVLDDGVVGEVYLVPLVASGGDGVYTWFLPEGSALPGGLSLMYTETDTFIEGIPSEAGVFDFSLELSSAGRTISEELSITVVLPPLEITTGTSLPSGKRGSPYDTTVSAIGGLPPYVWQVDSLPEGLSLSEAGVISGTPLESGRFDLDLTVADSSDLHTTATFTLEIAEPDPLSCDTTSLRALELGHPTSGIHLSASGGIRPYRWESVEARLADAEEVFNAVPGLQLSAAGEISGSPSRAGAFTWTTVVRDSEDTGTNCEISVEVKETSKPVGLRLLTTTLPDAKPGIAYDFLLRAEGGAGLLRWSLQEGSLPTGLDLEATGRIVGTPVESDLEGADGRDFAFVVSLKDSSGSLSAPLQIHLVKPADPEPEPEEPAGPKKKKKDGGGCQAIGADPSLLALLLGAGLVARRSRRG